MKVTTLSFPYPLIGVRDEIKGIFSIRGDTSALVNDGGKSKFKSIIDLENDYIEEMLRSKTVSITVEITCAATFYREVYKLYDKVIEISLDSDLLRESVDIVVYLTAEVNIDKYSNPDFSEDYSGYSFDIKKGDVMGYAGGVHFSAELMYEDIRKISSFMQINESPDAKEGPAKYLINGNKIIIELSKKDYELYERYKDQNANYSDLFHACFVMPALIVALTEMKSENAFQYEDFTWYRVLSARKNMSDLADIWNSSGPLHISQIILENPYYRALNSLKNISKQLIQENNE